VRASNKSKVNKDGCNSILTTTMQTFVNLRYYNCRVEVLKTWFASKEKQGKSETGIGSNDLAPVDWFFGFPTSFAYFRADRLLTQ